MTASERKVIGLAEELRILAQKTRDFSASTKPGALLENAHQVAEQLKVAAEEIDGRYHKDINWQEVEELVERVIGAAARLTRTKADLQDTSDAELGLKAARKAIENKIGEAGLEAEKWLPRQDIWAEQKEVYEAGSVSYRMRIEGLEKELNATKKEIEDLRNSCRMAYEIMGVLGVHSQSNG